MIVVEKTDTIAAVGRGAFSRLSTSRGALLSYDRLLDIERDGRQAASYLIARSEERPVLILPLYEPRTPRWLNPAYDPSGVAALGADTSDPRKWILVGGCTDLATAVPHAAGSPDVPQALELVRRALHEHSKRAGRRLMAAYAAPGEVEMMRNLLGPHQIEWADAEVATFDVNAIGNGYPDTLKGSGRRTVTRDWSERDLLGLVATSTTWEHVMEEAMPLVTSVAQRHGIPEHPELARMRLESWNSHDDLETVAFCIRDRAGAMLGVSFNWVYDETLQVYDIGLSDSPHRHVVYVEVLLYAPLRFAIERGCSRIDLGSGSINPKRFRGADVIELVSVAQPEP